VRRGRPWNRLHGRQSPDGGSEKIAAFVVTEFMAAFFTYQVALLVVALAALMGKFEAALVVKLMVAFGAFMKMTAGHLGPPFGRHRQEYLHYIICMTAAACYPVFKSKQAGADRVPAPAQSLRLLSRTAFWGLESPTYNLSKLPAQP
jgi:hypothetical protein